MSNSDEAIREIAEKHFPCVGTRNDREYRKMEQDALVSSITALISEHYVERERYDEAVRQRDELRKENMEMKAALARINLKLDKVMEKAKEL